LTRGPGERDPEVVTSWFDVVPGLKARHGAGAADKGAADKGAGDEGAEGDEGAADEGAGDEGTEGAGAATAVMDPEYMPIAQVYEYVPGSSSVRVSVFTPESSAIDSIPRSGA